MMGQEAVATRLKGPLLHLHRKIYFIIQNTAILARTPCPLLERFYLSLQPYSNNQPLLCQPTYTMQAVLVALLVLSVLGFVHSFSLSRYVSTSRTALSLSDTDSDATNDIKKVKLAQRVKNKEKGSER